MGSDPPVRTHLHPYAAALGTALVLSLVVPACGSAEIDAPPLEEMGYWIGRPYEHDWPPLWAGWKCGRMTFPTARNGSMLTYGMANEPRVWLCLSRSDFTALREDVATGDESGSLQIDRPEDLASDWIARSSKLGGRALPHDLALGRSLPWRYIREGWRALATAPGCLVRLRVTRWPRGTPSYLGGRLVSCTESGASQEGPKILLSGAGDRLVLTVGSRSWFFPPVPDDFADVGWLEAANRIWEEADAELGKRFRGETGVRLLLDDATDHLLYAHVVTVLDLCQAHDLRDVWFQQDGTCLTLSPRTDVVDAEPGSPLRGWVIVAGVLAGIVGFLIPFVPHLWRRKTGHRDRTGRQPSRWSARP